MPQIESSRCHSSESRKKRNLIRLLTVSFLGLSVLAAFLTYGTVKRGQQESQESLRQESLDVLEHQLLSLSPENLEALYETEVYVYYEISPQEMEKLEEGFWNQTVSWETAYPSLSDSQKQAMQKLGEEMSWEPLSHGDALALLEDQGATYEEAREILDVSRIDWNKQALRRCLLNLRSSAVSKLEMEHYLKSHGFTEKEVRHALLNCGADWKKQAEIAARELFTRGGYSRQGAIDFLKYYGYPQEDAAAAVDLCKRDFNREALRKVFEYLRIGPCTYESLLANLQSHKFTHDQAVYAITQVGLLPD